LYNKVQGKRHINRQTVATAVDVDVTRSADCGVVTGLSRSAPSLASSSLSIPQHCHSEPLSFTIDSTNSYLTMKIVLMICYANPHFNYLLTDLPQQLWTFLNTFFYSQF